MTSSGHDSATSTGYCVSAGTRARAQCGGEVVTAFGIMRSGGVSATIGMFVVIASLMAAAPVLAQGISNITTGSPEEDKVLGVQVGAGSTVETTNGTSGGGARVHDVNGDAPGYACFNIDKPEAKKQCFRAMQSSE